MSVVLGLGVSACEPDASSGTGGRSGSSTSSTGGSSGTATGDAGSTSGTGGDAGSTQTGTSSGSGGSAGALPTFTTSVITNRHRFIPGQMFGGWGPHLGHLIRSLAQDESTALYWVDDACSQAGGPAPVCDVLHNSTLGTYRLDAAGWTALQEVTLPGKIQQNTGTIEREGTLYTYGVDVESHVVRECSFDTTASVQTCTSLPFTLDSYANYIGAAISPQGYRLVHWTDVVDGGGGSFEFIINYGGGWNGPRKGSAAGYNDASYIHIAFQKNSTLFTMHGQLVSGLAPNWSFLGAVGDGDLAQDLPVTWSNALAAPQGDTVASTNDIHIDPVSSDTHLFARATSGAALYYFRPNGGSWSGPLFTLPSAYRVRFSASSAGLAMAYGLAGKGLFYRLAPSPTPGEPIDWSNLVETAVPLPPGYENVVAIYPESSVYQSAPVGGFHLAVVGETKQNEVLFVAIQP
ncbi:MAG: hypothetical protein IPK82_16820 [Polyangiaceae bacterium]|nr:hypothetical protein [Polyangiaceae bacterium]